MLLDLDACGPCRAFAPIYERAARAHPDIVFGKIDTEVERGLAAAFEIHSILTLMVFRDGILVFAEPGALPPAALEKLIAQVRALDMDAVRYRLHETTSASTWCASRCEHYHDADVRTSECDDLLVDRLQDTTGDSVIDTSRSRSDHHCKCSNACQAICGTPSE